MLFAVVDRHVRYKAKDVIETVVCRFGDSPSEWFSAAILPFSVAGLAAAGVIITVFRFPIA